MTNKKVTKLQCYRWHAIDKQSNTVQGDIHAATLGLAKAALRRQGVTPTKVRRKAAPLFSPKTKKIKPIDIALFTRQMATLMTAGIPVIQAFDIIGKGHSNNQMQTLLSNIKSDITSGLSMAQAFKQYPNYFNDLFCHLIHAGEKSGTLDALLANIATYKEKIESIKSKIKKALFYPTAIVIVALLVTMILLVFVVPQFELLFKGFDANLPSFTLLVLHISDYVQDFWWLLLANMAALFWLLPKLKQRYKKFHYFIDKSLLKLPIVGLILTQAAIARYARTLSTTFAAGLPLVDALDTVAGSVGNLLYRDAVLQQRDAVTTGISLHVALQHSPLFPNMVIQMVAIGEESGSLDKMLSNVADYYEEAVDNAVDSLSSLLEPLIMVILGVLIGGLIIAMYLPIFKLGAVV